MITDGAVPASRYTITGVSPRRHTAPRDFAEALGDYLEAAGISYVIAVPKNTTFADSTGCEVTVENVPTRIGPSAWQRRACGIGTKGYRVYDWAVINSADPDHQYMIRRSIDNGELAFYHCYNPRRETAGELVGVAGARWPIEECFQTTKGDIGLDNYQVRLYHAWYRHITLAMLAHTFLATLARRHRAKKGAPHPVVPAPNPTPPPTTRSPAPQRTNRPRRPRLPAD